MPVFIFERVRRRVDALLVVRVAKIGERAVRRDHPGHDGFRLAQKCVELLIEQLGAARAEQAAENHVMVAGRMLAVRGAGKEAAVDHCVQAAAGDFIIGLLALESAEAVRRRKLAERLVKTVICVADKETVIAQKLMMKLQRFIQLRDRLIGIFFWMPGGGGDEIGEPVGTLSDAHVVPGLRPIMCGRIVQRLRAGLRQERRLIAGEPVPGELKGRIQIFGVAELRMRLKKKSQRFPGVDVEAE